MVSGNAVCTPVTTEAATLFINNPTITGQPANASVLRGNTATFSVVASAATTYQWQRSTTLNGTYVNVVDATPAGVTYTGADSATLTVVTNESAAISTGNFYRCVVTYNGCAVNSAGAQLTINGYCTPTAATSTSSYFDQVTMSGSSSFDNSASGFSTNGYGNFTSLFSVSQILGNSVSYTTSLVGTTVGVAIWVDWNKNGTFETTERVANTTGYVSTFSGSFVVPVTATVGTTRMRIMMDYNNSNPSNPCTQGTRAETEDYTFEILPQPVCASGSFVAGTAATSNASLCYGNATTVSLTGFTTGVAGLTYQWYSSANGVDFSPVSGANSTSLSTGALTANAYYYCIVSCSEGGSSTSNTVAITVSNPLITGSTPAGRCGTGTVILGAAANEGSTINWYATATGGSLLGTGTSFTTPSISTTTTYYAEAVTGSGTGNAASTYTGTSTNGSSTGSHGVAITTTVPNVKIESVAIPFTGTGTLTIALKDATNTTVLSSVTTGTVTGTGSTALTIPLNLTVPTAGNYLLIVNSVTGTVGALGYSTVTYPLTALGGTFSVTGGYWFGTTTSNMYLYNLAVSTGCSSTRTAVVATVDALPTATISYAGSPYCSTATTAAVTRTGTTGGAYSSTAGLSIDSSTGTIDVAASTPGTYTVTYTMLPTTYCTAQTATATVVINQALTSSFAYDVATYCTNQGTATPTITGSAGTFTASPAGLSINATTGAITLASSAAGTYTVTNTVAVAGCANSVSTFEVTINNAVAITTQPISVSQLPGDNTSFTVAATGTGLTYQWEVNSGSGWSALSGETAATLSLTAVTAEMNGYLYRVVVSGATACTSVTSSAATLTVSTAAIATHPVNFTACNTGANTATFSVTTTGTVDTYQWQVSTNNGVDWTNITNGGIYANADTATLSLSGVTLSDNNNQFRCVLNGVVNSNAATLFVKEAVAIATQPSSAVGCTAGSASFTVAATGDGLAYQWQVSTNSGSTWDNVASATSATLTLNSLTAGMNGYQYQVIVSGAAPCSAVTSSVVTLTVNTAVAISAQPANTTVCNAANATFTVTATGTSLGYQWEVNTGSGWSALSGETNASLTVSAVTTAMSGYQYRVVVSGVAPCGSVTSSAATLTVSQPAVPTITASTLDYCQGSVVTLTAGNIAVGVNSTSFDVLPTNFATTVVGSGTPTAVLNTTYKSEGTGSVLFNTTSTSANVAYGMNTNVNLSGLSGVQLTFSHQALMEGPTTSYDYGFVQYSSDGGATWTNFQATDYVGAALATFNANARFSARSYPDWISNFTSESSLPNNSLWKTETFNIPVSALTSQFRIRFRYTTDSGVNYYGWLIDDVRISIPNAGNTWTPTTGLFTNAAATTAYTGGNATTVYAKPNGAASYTLTTTNSLGCTNTASVNLNMLAPSTLSSITQPSVTCSGSQTTFALTGLLPNSTSTIGYTINGTAQTAITGVVADASGNATFTVALPAVNNGRTLAVTSLTRTDLTPNCTTAITANNTVVISVQPLVTYYADADGDGFGNNAVTQITCTGAPVGYVTNNTDCDDNDNTKNATYPFYADNDGDGFGTGTAVQLCAVNATTPPAGYSVNNTDCDDNDNTKNATYPFYADTDGDGFGAGTAVQLCAVNATTPPAGYSVNDTDCAPNDGTKSQSYSFYADADGDGYGAGSLVSVCAVNATTPPSGYSLNNTDCNDANIALFTTYSFYADTDGDGYGAGSLVSVCAVDATTPPAGYSLDNKDCAPTDPTKWRSTLLYIDNDGDGYDNGNENVCWGTTVPTGYSESTLGNDCDDTNPLRNLTNPCETVVTVKMFIEGYYDADAHAMRPVMMNQGVGSSATDVDTVTIELHDATTYELVASASATLQTNGNAVATFTTAPSGSFYIVVKHRNALETWSANAVTVGATPSSYDFTTAASQAYGDNMKMLESGVYGFYSGDLNQDGFIEGLDFPFLFNDIDNFLEGYHPTDLNGDGFVEGLDFPFLFNNIDAFIELLRPY
ncbi:MAG: GEVED domain-containing protein [Flavobacterium sp.]